MSDREKGYYRNKYKPPQQGFVFKERWNVLIEHIGAKDNFNPNHLYQLEELCSLYEQAANLTEILSVTGPSYATVTDKGHKMTKTYPETEILRKVRNQIGIYSRALGLNSEKKITKGSVHDEDNGSEWT